jgi:prepilin-type N-terminal cleavage/methylation domain-containing protein
MKKSSSKKGFSLIELIVVIAVIAAIAAVIVPSITNFNAEARRTADRRNIQLWNQTYLEAFSAGATANAPSNWRTSATEVTALDEHVLVGATDVRFSAPAFNLTAGTIDAGGTAGTGFIYTVNP